MMQSNTTIFLDNFITFLYISGLFSWGYLTLVLMEVTICKDARKVDTAKLLHRPIPVRLRLFKRSLRNLFYRSSFGLFIGAFLMTMYLINQLWTNHPKHIQWIIFHDIFPLSLTMLYRYLGHGVAFFDRFRLFLKGETN